MTLNSGLVIASPSGETGPGLRTGLRFCAFGVRLPNRAIHGRSSTSASVMSLDMVSLPIWLLPLDGGKKPRSAVMK